jgi:cell division protein FtsW
MRKIAVDKLFLLLSVLLTTFGFIIFTSASLGLLARDGATFSRVVTSQLLLGILFGGIVAFIITRLDYRTIRKASFFVFLGSLILTLLVFVPGIGLSHNGATRWISVFGLSLQPAELLKLGFILYLANWLARSRAREINFKQGVLPFMVLSGICAVVLLLQPDTDTFAVIFLVGLSMLFVKGAKIKDIGVLLLIAALGLSMLAMTRPYIKERLLTFVDPSRDSLDAGYQIQQSLIAIGSGGWNGRGFGQSVQKFDYLPEPIGDSIFSVFAEEFGFIGSALLVLLFLAFGLRGLRIAHRAPNSFARLTVIGIVILIMLQSFINISAMLGIVPLSGLPLLFVSHGGSALFMTLVGVGIVLNISKHQIKS